MDREAFASAWEKHIADFKAAHPQLKEEDLKLPEPGEEEATLLRLPKKGRKNAGGNPQLATPNRLRQYAS